MEKINPSESFRARAYEAIDSAKDALAGGHLETAVSRSYYACYYAIHSRLEEKGKIAGSHKQTGILFREFFIKNGAMDKKYSTMFRELSEWRMDADYSPMPETSHEKVAMLVQEAEEFVKTILSIPLPADLDLGD